MHVIHTARNMLMYNEAIDNKFDSKLKSNKHLNNSSAPFTDERIHNVYRESESERKAKKYNK